MSWFYLLLAGVFEIVFALPLEYSKGFVCPAAAVTGRDGRCIGQPA